MKPSSTETKMDKCFYNCGMRKTTSKFEAESKRHNGKDWSVKPQ